MKTVWMGSCNQWDCDDMGHMNVRVYIEKQHEGLMNFASALGLSHAFYEGAPSTLLPIDQHIRYIREARPGAPLSMKACVLEHDDTTALIYQEMRHVNGALAAAFRTRVQHVETKLAKPFNWSSRSRKALAQYTSEAPDESKPRSIDPVGEGIAPAEANMERIESIGAPLIGLGAILPRHLDVHGRMAPYWFMGRVSDSVPNLLHEWRQRVASAAGSARMGAAVLEYRLRYHGWPVAGDLFEIHSSLGDVADKTHSLVHWVMNPKTGKAWVTSQATAITMDLDARKAVKTPPAMRKEIENIAPRGLVV